MHGLGLETVSKPQTCGFDFRLVGFSILLPSMELFTPAPPIGVVHPNCAPSIGGVCTVLVVHSYTA